MNWIFRYGMLSILLLTLKYFKLPIGLDEFINLVNTGYTIN